MKKVETDKRLEEHNRGVYGIFIVSYDDGCHEQCAYVGKSEQLSVRTKQHFESLLYKNHITSLNNAMDDDELKIEIRLIEPVEYEFDNYYKDAQRLTSRENYWIDEYQKNNQCLEQVPEGRRPGIEKWEHLKNNSMK